MRTSILVVALAVTACSHSSPEQPPEAPVEGISLTIFPASVTLSPAQAQRFYATQGEKSVVVSWRLQEPDGGSISESGLYVAPSQGGTYHIVAVSKTDPSVRGLAEIFVTADESVPETFLTNTPPATIQSAEPSFSFKGSDDLGVSSFECRIDDDGWVPCTSPHQIYPLAEGDHVFQVRAVDVGGNRDATPALWLFTTDYTGPETVVLSGPPPLTNATVAVIAFTATDNGLIARFECLVDWVWEPCTSPIVLPAGEGENYFVVRAVDEVGNEELLPAVWSWTVDNTGPKTVFSAGPAGTTDATDATIAFSVTDGAGVASISCRTDGGVWQACDSPQSFSNLASGSTHSLEVRGIDSLGNVETPPAWWGWSIAPFKAGYVASGQLHACVVTELGAVKCWGSNSAGQLGNASQIDSPVPVDVVGLGSGVTTVVAGGGHSCALLDTGAVKCWGSNSMGELGDGTKRQSNVPVAVSGLQSGIQAIASKGGHSCALGSGGGVKCWGRNDWGQLGIEMASPYLDGVSVPVDVVGLTGATQITVGSVHSCAVVAGGALKCWGGNASGQLGDGTTAARYAPVTVNGLYSGVRTVAAGWSTTCAIMESTGLKCWGANTYGALGDGTTTNRSVPADVPSLLTGVSQVSVGFGSTCAVVEPGDALCWGYNAFGTLGDGSGVDRTTPTPVTEMSSLITHVAVGNLSSCAVTNSGGIRCCGKNERGQLGFGRFADKTQPQMVSGSLPAASAVATGDEFSCALSVAGGVYCWGANYNRRLGNGTDRPAAYPVAVSGLASGVSAIAVGLEHGCALTPLGGVQCWGSNAYGSLGTAKPPYYSNAVTVTGLSSGVTAISAGGFSTCALTNAGGVVCWGRNDQGQLGDGTTTDRSAPVQVDGLSSGVADVSVGTNHACVVMQTGAVKCWGYSYWGSLGTGGDTSFIQSTPAQVIGLASGVAKVSSGYLHTCIVTSGGGARCWGANWYGSLGSGSDVYYQNTPVDVVGLTAGVAAISARTNDTCAVTSTGALLCWGQNRWGEVGDGSTTHRNAPAEVVGLPEGVSRVSAGNHACAVLADGSVACWGRNTLGQLGDGDAWKGSPLPVYGFP